MRTIILAGGFATRLWPLSENTAKPLLHLAGQPLISTIAKQLPEETEIIISTNAVFAEAFEAWREDFRHRNVKVFIEDSAVNETKKTGELEAVALVLEQFGLEQDVLVLAGDNHFGFDFKSFLADAKDVPLLAAYDVGDLEQAKKYGVIVPGDDHQVIEFQEKPAEPKSTLVSTGALYFPRTRLAELCQFAQQHNDDLGGVFEHFLSKGQCVDYFAFSQAWFDIGSFPAYLEAQRHLIGDQVIDQGATQRGENVLKGSVFLGPDCLLENVTLENAIIEPGTTLRDCTVRDSVIGPRSTIRGVDLSGVCLRQESWVVQ